MRELPEAEPLRPAGAVPLVAGHFGRTDLSADDVALIEHASKAIGDILVCVANVLERDLTAAEQKPFRDHVRAHYLRGFGLDPNSERHAQAVLVGLIKVAAEAGWPDGLDDEGVGVAVDERVSWILQRYSEDFGEYATKLSLDERRAKLRGLVATWCLSSNGHTPQAGVWRALESLGAGVFQSNTWKNWRDNVWAKDKGLRALVCGDDDRLS